MSVACSSSSHFLNQSRCLLHDSIFVEDGASIGFRLTAPTHVRYLRLCYDSEWSGPLILSLGVVIFGSLSFILYNILFSPLARIPGPFLAKTTPFWIVSALRNAQFNQDVQQLHQKYGPVVRLSPNELSFATVEAQNAIHRPGQVAHRSSKLSVDLQEGEVEEDSIFFGKHGTLEAMMGRIVWPAKNLLTVTSPDEHKRLKRALQPAFTNRALRKQEPIQQRHTDRMCKHIQECIQSNDTGNKIARVDLTPFITRTIWDIISDLSFGHPLPRDQLDKFESLKTTFCKLSPILETLQCALVVPGVNWICWKCVNSISWVFRQWRPVDLVPNATIRRHMERSDGNQDFLQALLSCKQRGVELSRLEIMSNASLLVMVGYDTTVTSLSALLSLLLRHPQYMSALLKELQSCYQSTAQMTADSLAQLPLLNGCIKESLRLFPPANGKGTSRTAPKISIDGVAVAAGVNVSADMWTIQRNPAYWTEADQFHPERWLDNGPGTTWEHDVRSSFAPFLVGPRMCIGRSVALQSMRIVVAKLIWSFKIEARPGMEYDWEKDVSSSYLWTGYTTTAIVSKMDLGEQHEEVERHDDVKSARLSN